MKSLKDFSKSLQLIGTLSALFFSESSAQMCPPSSGTELIANGNFESCIIGNLANDGFTTGYTYSGTTSCPGGAGSATIGQWSASTNATLLNGAYINPPGTPGTGNPSPNHYLVVDVDGTANKSVYNTSVNVTSGTTYYFSAWLADINTTYTNPPILRFLINGVQVGKTVYVDSLANTNAWQQFYVFWTAPSSGAVAISIVNDRLTSSGNDLALDNLSFSTSCASIKNLNSLGSTSNLIDTLYSCNVAYPFVLNPHLGAGYTYQWKNSSGTVLGTGSTYSFSSAPATGKYYLCYDTIPGCPRTDSLYVSNALSVNIQPNQMLCPPVNFTINPGLTSSGINYLWKLDGSQVANSTSATTYQATQVGTYSLTVSKAACGNATSQMTITSPTQTLQGTTSCGNGGYLFTATSGTYNMINGVSNVAFYNVPSGGTALNTSGTTSYVVTSTATLATTPGCAIGGLYIEDLNSFNTTLGPTTLPCTAANISTTGGNAGAMLLTVYSNITINSLQIVQQNYSTGGTATYTVQILNNSPGSGPYSSACNCQTDGPGSVIAASLGPTVSFPQTTSPVVRTLTVGSSGNGYALTGSAAGTKYWIQLTGSEFGYLNCGSSFPYANNPNPGVIELTEQLVFGNMSTQLEAFNIRFTEGTPNICSRTWVCASSSCALPVELLYVNGSHANNINIVQWATATEINNAYFILERSTDGINFFPIGKVEGKGNSNTVLTYEYHDLQIPYPVSYYRLKQVDVNGAFTYSEIISIQYDRPVQIYVDNEADVLVVNIVDRYQAYKISITDLAGKTVYTNSGNEIPSNISMNNFTNGIYIVQLETKNGRVMEKVVIL